MRVEPCACGGRIAASSLKQARDAVSVHNATLQHISWRSAMGIVNITPVHFELMADLMAELVPSGPSTYQDPRRRPTAAASLVDVSGNTSGASADDGGPW